MTKKVWPSDAVRRVERLAAIADVDERLAAIDAEFGRLGLAADTVPIPPSVAEGMAVVLRARTDAVRATWSRERYMVATGVRARQSEDVAPLPRRAGASFRALPF